jgi:hypothetical protein
MSGSIMSPYVGHRFGKEVKIIEATFALDAANNPTINSHASLAEAGLSLVEGPTAVGSAGQVRVTTADPYWRLVHASACYSSAADNTDLYAQKPVCSNVGAGVAVTALIRLKTGATSTNPPAAATGNELSIRLVFEDATSAAG